MSTRALTLDEHDSTVKDGIVLIDFWAAWCGPCRQFGPIFERVSEKHPDATFVKVDTEAEPELMQRYGISSIPTLVVYRDGIPVFGQPGALPEPVLEDVLRQVRELDMDAVREQYAEQLASTTDQPEAPTDETPTDETPTDEQPDQPEETEQPTAEKSTAANG